MRVERRWIARGGKDGVVGWAKMMMMVMDNGRSSSCSACPRLARRRRASQQQVAAHRRTRLEKSGSISVLRVAHWSRAS